MTHSNSIQMSSHAFSPVVDEQVYSQLLEELSSGLEIPIAHEPYDFEPPAAGMSEIAATISFLADSKEVLLPIVSWLAGRFGGPAFKTFRAHVDGSRQSRQSSRPYVPLCVTFGTNPENPGSVRFYFHGRPDEEELKHQFDEMHRVIDALPEQALAEQAGPPKYGFFWDDEEARWRGQLYYSGREAPRENWFPPDLLDKVPGWTALQEGAELGAVVDTRNRQP